MRHLLLVALLSLAAQAPPAPSPTTPTVRPDARIVPAGERYLLRGRDWPTGASCEDEVRISRRLGHGVVVGRADIARDGTFTFARGVPRAVTPGTRIVLDVTQYCSGTADGVGITRTVRLRVGPPARRCRGAIGVDGPSYLLETWGGLRCGVGARAIGPFLDTGISPDGFDCERTDPRLGFRASCRATSEPAQRVTARRLRVDDRLTFTRADGSRVPFGPQIDVWCGRWEADVPTRSIHVRVGDGSPTGWLVSAVVADVRRRPVVRFPHSFVFDQPEGARVFAVDGSNEVNSDTEESRGRIRFGRVRCGRTVRISFTIDGRLGSELGDLKPIAVRGSFSAAVS